MIFRPPVSGRGQLSSVKMVRVHKYWAIFKITWQKSFEYRADFIGHLGMGMITFVVMYFVWSAVFKNQTYFRGYTFSAMMTYVLLTKFLHFTSRGNIGRQMATEIKDGGFSAYLVKPISYLRWWFFAFLADRGFEFFVRLGMIVMFFLILPQVVIFSGIVRFFLFLSFLIIALIINYLINVLVASFAFWVTDVRLFRQAMLMIFEFLGGSLVPLDVMPSFLKNFSFLLPFQFTTFFPIRIYQGSMNANQVLNGILLAFGWIFILLVIVRFLWGKGVKKYEAIGQ